MKQEDRIEQIDGVDTKDMTLDKSSIGSWRGWDRCQRDGPAAQGEARTLKATRGPLFIATITGVQKKLPASGIIISPAPDSIGYLRIRDISASTPHELRTVAQELEGANSAGPGYRSAWALLNQTPSHGSAGG